MSVGSSLFSRALAAGLCAGLLATTVLAAERNLVPAASRAQPASEPRIALVIGNADYPNSPLANPVNDAVSIAERLALLRFSVTRLENATQDQMYEAIRAFGDQLRGGGVGLFYYAGHALQVRGRNYLLPVRAKIEREDEILYRTVDTGLVLDKMESARNRVNIVILDACRNNPFGRDFRNVTPGLAVVDAPHNTLIAFATAPGAVASDGSGRNGLYTQHLLQALSERGLGLEDVFKKVRGGVRRDSAGRQVPWESTSLEVDFFFDPLPQQAAAAAPTAPDPMLFELEFWSSVKGSADPEDYRAYLRRYPKGQFVALAENRLRLLVAPPAAAPGPPAASAPSAPHTVTTAPAPVVTAPVAPPQAPTPTPTPAPAVAIASPALPPAAAAPPGAARELVPLRSPPVPSGEIRTIALSRSGSLALTGATDRVLRLWDLATGRELRRLSGNGGAVTAVAIAVDGRQFLSGSTDRGVRVWDAASGTQLARLDGHAAGVSAVAFGPTARYAVSAGDDGELLLWDLPGGGLIRRAKAGSSRVGSLALSPEGRFLLSAADDGAVLLWDVGALAVTRRFGPLPAAAVAATFSDAARRVVAVDARGEVWVWDAGSGALLRRFGTGARTPVLAAFSADGRTVLSSGSDGPLALWDTESGQALWRPGTPAGRRLTALALGPRGVPALSADDSPRLLLWTTAP